MFRAVQNTETETHHLCTEGIPINWRDDSCVIQWHQTRNSVVPGESLLPYPCSGVTPVGQDLLCHDSLSAGELLQSNRLQEWRAHGK